MTRNKRESTRRPVQYFSDEYLDRCRAMTIEERLEFLESFRLLHESVPRRSRRISLSVKEDLLEYFRRKCALAGVPYQTQIERLMSRWVGVIEG